MNRKEFRNIPLRLLPAMVLLLFLLFGSTNAILGTYRSSVSGSAAARVASFHVEAGELKIVSGDTLLDCGTAGDMLICEFDITNDSEVAVKYSVEIGGLGESLKCDVENGENTLEPGKEGTVRMTLSVLDEEDLSQQTVYNDLQAAVTVIQKELP